MSNREYAKRYAEKKKAQGYRWGKIHVIPRSELAHHVFVLSKTIDWMLPFLNEKAKGSGNVTGLQMNAMQAVKDAQLLLSRYEESLNKENRWIKVSD